MPVWHWQNIFFQDPLYSHKTHFYFYLYDEFITTNDITIKMFCMTMNTWSHFLCISVKNASPDVCKVLVGNKLDAEDERVIETSRGKSVRWTMKLRPYLDGFGYLRTPPSLLKDNFTEHLYGVVSYGSSLPPPFSIVTVWQVLYLTVSSGAGEPSPGVYMRKSWLSWILVPFPGSDFSTTWKKVIIRVKGGVCCHLSVLKLLK